MSKRNLLIASTSTVFGKPYLEYLKDEVKEIFSASKEILFIPYARPGGITYDEYTIHARKFFESNGMTLKGLQEFDNPNEGLGHCEAIFTGGGNTFVLLKSLYDQDLLFKLRDKISEGIPYLGTSAGSNILGATIRTTNDMPIEYPPSFEAIGAVPFNINPHYIDPDPSSKHMGETRETRIKEFHVFNDLPVVGLREGSYLRVKGEEIKLGGPHSARIFDGRNEPYELLPEDDFSFLL
jgi:dipeptidase E